MEKNFITKEQATDTKFIQDIVTSVIGRISSVTPCASEACNSYAYIVDNHLIIKFPHDEIKLGKLNTEGKVLSFLKGKTTLKIPESRMYESPFPFSVHEMIKGDNFHNTDYQKLSPAEQEKFCYDIAVFMYELHSLTHQITNLNLPFLKGVTSIYPAHKMKSVLIKCDQLTTRQKDYISDFCDHFHHPFSAVQKVFGHFDIQPKNTAFDFGKNKFSGIYDFGDCGFCETSYDFIQFAIQYHPEILKNVLRQYEKISHIYFDPAQIMQASTYRLFYCIVRDIENNRPIDMGIKNLNLKMSYGAK